jgi:ABC-type uncharacterized transport system involved in gliding motility auxiliary subunit
VNEKNRNKLEYAFVDPSNPAELDQLSAKYGLQKISWGKQGAIEAGSGLLGIVLEYGDKIRTIPVTLVRGLLGGYGIAGLDGLDQRLAENLQALMSNSLGIGYLTGHGERSLYDQRQGAANLASLVSDLYEFKELDLAKDDIPASMTTVVINGPRSKYGEAELYKLDQFLMRGGSILAMIDPFDEQMPQGGNPLFGGGQPAYIPIDTGLDALLDKYGAKLGRNYVLDSECYVSRQKGVGEMQLYYVPVIGKKGLNRKNPVSRNLANVLFLKAGEVAAAIPAGVKDRTATPLVSSSAESWLLSDNISLVPYMLSKPGKDKLAKHDLAVLLEGRFESGFAKAPAAGARPEQTDLKAETHLSRSVQNGKIIVVGTSEIAGQSLIDEEGRQPVAVLVRNALDYLAGNQELNDMRTKGLGLDPLDKTAPGARIAAKTFNQYGLPLLAVFAGLFAWRMRIRRREKIRTFYARSEDRKVES